MRFTSLTAEAQLNRVRAIREFLHALEGLERVGLMVKHPIYLDNRPGEEDGGVQPGVVRVKYTNESVPNSSFYYIFGDDEE